MVGSEAKALMRYYKIQELVTITLGATAPELVIEDLLDRCSESKDAIVLWFIENGSVVHRMKFQELFQ